jgi:glycerol-3-phosphate acyltransferase PlsY
MWPSVALAGGAYLLGSLPIMRFIARLRGVDLSMEPDLHIAIWRKVGPLEGLIGVMGDFAKGVVPVLVGRALDLPIGAVALAGAVAVAGQMWPVFGRFNGEKGNSTGVAMAAALDWRALLPALAIMLTGVAIRTIPRLRDRSQSANERLKLAGPPSNSLPLAMIIAFALLPVFSWWMGRSTEFTFAFLAIFVLIAVRRVTAGVRKDFATGLNKWSIVRTRLLYDRGFL